ncbi:MULTISPECIES: STAS domain-containing protein [Streptomyces]|uniref:STAS domain-containing protein n=1 Tax=Streptomyces glycanivorans TaxID=3033808 RepID=A0ABY9JGK2_9ACTN|nr:MULTISPECIES: STAS domain-containing protein [unclassified Streptomyces]WSQ79216.1 STAS domain-containing protein [Streptomyces sp. NBC_01213]TXS17425.1 anti-sigma factor antagonist [Streptomyces sp. wa22]WLQ65801.1 STAS domain-containing protein [Streptomyces sp. Alt3]WSQ86584.1 STAS domain-containing protein [Streptomyces sp. NBC_01212]WSR07366.1 STAS domain-containing protein [Streptomyces sp. NBC_01208]
MVREPLDNVDNSAPAGPPVVAAEGEVNGHWVVRAQGDLDCDTIDPLFIALWQAAPGHQVVVLDASAVTFADSSFLSLLIEVHRRTELRVAAPGAVLTRLLRTSGVDRVIRSYPTLDAALGDPPRGS